MKPNNMVSKKRKENSKKTLRQNLKNNLDNIERIDLEISKLEKKKTVLNEKKNKEVQEACKNAGNYFDTQTIGQINNKITSFEGKPIDIDTIREKLRCSDNVDLTYINTLFNLIDSSNQKPRKGIMESLADILLNGENEDD